MYRKWLQLDAGAGGAGGGGGGETNTFLTSLPPDLQKEPSLATFKDPGALAKSYVEAQKLIGAKRIALPGEKASESEWESFYNSIGRPETVDKYPDVVLKDEKGNVIIQPDKAQADELKKVFHKMGLTARQAQAMQEYSLKYLHASQTEAAKTAQQQSEAAINGLKQEWGDKFDSKVDTARAVVKKFAGDSEADLIKFLDDSGLGNNTQLVKLFASIGESIMEDTSRRGGNGALPLNDVTRARAEIDQLKSDAQFQKQLNSATEPGHMEAVNRWTNLFKIAFPGSQE
ncbi:putative protease [Caudoviricetes sp.]|nr:putative protease [Caudoviricetes sp.]